MYSITLKIDGKFVDRRYSKTQLGSYWDQVCLLRKLFTRKGCGFQWRMLEAEQVIQAWKNGVLVAEFIYDDNCPMDPSEVNKSDKFSLAFG